MDIFGVPHRHGGAKRSPFLKFVTYILQWWNLSVIPYLKQIQKYTKYVTHPLSFADIRIFFTFVKSRNIGIDFFSIWVSLSRPFTNHGTAGKGGGHLLNSSLPLPAVSQTLRHWPGDYCREPTSTHSQQLNSNRKPLISERKLLTTKLWALIFLTFSESLKIVLVIMVVILMMSAILTTLGLR